MYIFFWNQACSSCIKFDSFKSNLENPGKFLKTESTIPSFVVSQEQAKEEVAESLIKV